MTGVDALGERLLACFAALDEHFGHEPHWWPVISDDPPFEVLVGAVLVQQTRWETVEAAIVRLRDAGLMSPSALAAARPDRLAALIRPCAFHAQKATGLHAICGAIVQRYDCTTTRLLSGERAEVRARLLALPRIGRETADTVMLYGGGHPVFVVDAYARRLFARLDLVPGFDFLRAPYVAVQHLIERALSPFLPALATIAGEPFHVHRAVETNGNGAFFFAHFHALIIEACVHHCLARNPRCDRPGGQRAFIDRRKCANHCLMCDGCPLRQRCATFNGTATAHPDAAAPARVRSDRA
ncbi:endonuclease III domain-containing protein [Roseiflexus sp.]|uniref:endonuclease III domain-containing protein n=1 Tax=Roseiflexus sp. TaxID=2562120 RepID=UPI0021DC10DE|nr:DNA repair protein [Roseiflexus sp.]GIW02466.1 MAG: (Fe-S)-cluster assembly protein [Roseiflexus sp.]